MGSLSTPRFGHGTLVDSLVHDVLRGLTPQNGNGRAKGCAFQPPVDIVEREDGYTLAFNVPGVAADALEIDLHERTLTVKGHKTTTVDVEGDGVRRVERRAGAFSRSFAFDQPLAAAEATSALHDGVLTISLPKAAAARPRRLRVETAGPTATAPLDAPGDPT